MTGTAFPLDRLGEGLPFAAALPDLGRALADGAAVVQAAPGTGKTTLVPPFLAGATEGRVVVTQPRRVAVRAAARRLAALAGQPLGRDVGFAVRGERVGRDPRVEFVTPGVLLRRLLAAPDLPGVGAIALDEVHERALETDLLVGMLAEVRALREDLLLVAMSATLDAARFADLLGDPAPVVTCADTLGGLTVAWSPPATPRFTDRGVARDFLDHVARTCVSAVREHPGDALVFVPGVHEVEHVARAVAADPRTPAGVQVLPLHGRLPAAEQDRATGAPTAAGRRIVVTTALAESSLTVPGVRLVVDAGLSREPRRDAARGMTGLVTVAASRQAAQQRAGRAARGAPGVAVRCYDEQTYARMPAQATPEIAAADLTGAALVLACWGAPGGVGLALPDPPPATALADAVAALTALGAVDADGRATAHGRALAAIPADPRAARALLDGAPVVGARVAAEVVAALADDHRAPGSDLTALLSGLRAGRVPGASAWTATADRLRAHAPTGRVPGTPHPIGYVVALAHPDRLARRVAPRVYELASGTRAALPPDSPLAGHEWLAVADVARAQGAAAAGTGAVIRSAAPISRTEAMAAGSTLRREEQTATWDGRRVVARDISRLGAIELSATPVPPAPDAARAAVRRAFDGGGLARLEWPEAAAALRRRVAHLHHRLGEPWPDVTDAALLARLEEWAGPELDALAAGTPASRLDLAGALRRLVPWPQAGRLDELAPERLPGAGAARPRLVYPDLDDPDGRVIAPVRLQACFGLETSPLVAGAPVLFHLLSPAGRPLAVTDDLASFWSGPYAQVRAQMRGRYPKHPWPEDPRRPTPR